jgi:ankyrin repeat protein
VLRGCSANTADANGMTALHHAAQHGLVEVAKLLKQLCDGTTGSSSSSSSSTAAGALLLNTADNSGWTPLMTAAAHGHTPFVRWLLETAASTSDTATANKAGRTALHLAASKGRDNVVRALLGVKDVQVSVYSDRLQLSAHIQPRCLHAYKCRIVDSWSALALSSGLQVLALPVFSRLF